jgi:hypothetical protein
MEGFTAMLGFIKKISPLLRSSIFVPQKIERIEQAVLQEAWDQLRKGERYQDELSLIPHGRKVYSQNEEDGIIKEIFNRIGAENKIFVEFGVGKGLENNTLALLFDGWQGLWIEGSPKEVNSMKKHLPVTIASGALRVSNAFINRNNINGLISAGVSGKEIDLLSIDIDGNDAHIFEAINCVDPRVVVIEYNARFPPPMLYCMDYDEGHIWKSDDAFGASLKYLEMRFAARGYCLVGCSLSGANAFFVKRELAKGKFQEPFSAEFHYEPARYYLGGLLSGHRASFAALEKSQACRRTE